MKKALLVYWQGFNITLLSFTIEVFMSGIFGYFNNTNKNNQTCVEILPMLKWNKAYGDELNGSIEYLNASFGCCVENLKDKHIQKKPVLTSETSIGVIDAMIYNRDELINPSETQETVSDAEFIFSYVNRLGFDALKNVNGDFSGAVYDKEKQELILFRDHMGIRPLFYYIDSSVIAFSTDIRGLTALPMLDTAISENWIYKTITGEPYEEIFRTPYSNIFMVKPASYIVFSFREEKVIHSEKKYWTLGKKRIYLKSRKEYTTRLRELISDSISRRLSVSPDPVGADLSGGLDSGVIDILINRNGRKGLYYSWSPDPKDVHYAENDERLIINDICVQENMTCHFQKKNSDYSVKLEAEMIRNGLAPDSCGSNDYRFAFPPNSNTYALIHGMQFMSSNGARVMFTGHGGDEGVSHRSNTYELLYHQEYLHYIHQVWLRLRNHKNPLRRCIKYVIKDISSHIHKDLYIDPFNAPELLNPDFHVHEKRKYKYYLDFAYNPKHYIESGNSLNRLHILSLFGAYSNIRPMVPFLDFRVIDYAISIPRYLYLNGRMNRFIYREAFKDIIPQSLYKQTDKEDNSYKNLEPDPNWFKNYQLRKMEIIDNLDREFWKRYLDFNVIDRLRNHGEPTDEEYELEMCQIKVLLRLGLAQNMVEKSRLYAR